MTTEYVDPTTVQDVLARAKPGDKIIFRPGLYGQPLVLRGIISDAYHPLILQAEPGVTLSMSIEADQFRHEANRRAKSVQEERRDNGSRKFPSLERWMMDGMLKIEECAHVQIIGFQFEKSWPTHIALDHSRHLKIISCQFTDATFAIGAKGKNTRWLSIELCSWIQDPEPDRLWKQIPWFRIHGAPDHEPPKPEDDPLVDIDHDWRLFDGDFFRGVDIAGDVTIRDCRIGKCFNAIHIFNDKSNKHLSRNINVQDCTFFEIRDNVIEPEKSARNWWFHRNILFNVHKAFSFECVTSSLFYVFANIVWFDSIQGPETGDGNKGGGIFKLAKKVEEPKGPSYVFHNSIYTRSDYLRKGIFPGLRHFNNAIHCVAKAGEDFNDYPNFFGNLSVTGSRHEKKRFTMDWEDTKHDISMQNDVVHYPGWPENLIEAGYPIGLSSRGAPLEEGLGFVDPSNSDLKGIGLKLSESSVCRNSGRGEEIQMPDQTTWILDGGFDVGAWQSDALFDGPQYRPLKEST